MVVPQIPARLPLVVAPSTNVFTQWPFAVLGRDGNGGEGGGFSGFDLDAPEVDRSIEVTLDDWLQEVARAHARPTRRQHQIGLF